MRGVLRFVVRHALARMSGRTRYQALFETLHGISLRGMNYGSGDYRTSGELGAIRRIAAAAPSGEVVTAFDIGANVGGYSVEVARAFAHAQVTIHAFEPATAAYSQLEQQVRLYPCIRPVHLGVSNTPGTRTLHLDADRSGLASVYQRDLETYGITLGRTEAVSTTTIDAYCQSNGVTHIDHMKIDVEGHELAVLQGCQHMIDNGAIDYVQFEFGEAAIDARHFLRDFFAILPHYEFFRILRDGLRPLSAYREEHEIFRTVNFLAIRHHSTGARPIHGRANG